MHGSPPTMEGGAHAWVPARGSAGDTTVARWAMGGGACSRAYRLSAAAWGWRLEQGRHGGGSWSRGERGSREEGGDRVWGLRDPTTIIVCTNLKFWKVEIIRYIEKLIGDPD